MDVKTMRLFDTVGRSGFTYAWQMLRNHDDALDAVQSSMSAVWDTRERLEPGRDPRAWFFRVLRNKCIDLLRSRRGRTPAPLQSEPADRGSNDPADAASRREQVDRLRAELDRLPDEMREIILLRDYHDLPYAEIAEVLAIPQGTVMSRLHRARSALRERMSASDGRS